jgi:hypothetical protein
VMSRIKCPRPLRWTPADLAGSAQIRGVPAVPDCYRGNLRRADPRPFGVDRGIWPVRATSRAVPTCGAHQGASEYQAGRRGTSFMKYPKGDA